MPEAVLLFLRHPEPGKAKTRLIPALGPEGAAALYRRLADRVAEVVRSLDRPGLDRIAYFEPPEREEEVGAWVGGAFRAVPQPDTELDGRLEAGFSAAACAELRASRISSVSVNLIEREAQSV